MELISGEAIGEFFGDLAKSLLDDWCDVGSLLLSVTPELEIFSGANRFTYHMLLNSCATHLDILRFELRALRFFNDICISLITFGVNKRHDYVWRNVIPKYFKSKDLVRRSMLAYGSLGLWMVSNLQNDLNGDCEDLTALELRDRGVGDLNSVFTDWQLFDVGEESNVFLRTATLYDETLEASNRALLMMQSAEFSYLDEAAQMETTVGMILASSLLYGFLGSHPFRMVPLVNFVSGDPNSTDVLHIVVGLKNLVRDLLDKIRRTDVGDLFHTDELFITFPTTIPLVDDLREQLMGYYQAIDFLDINDQVTNEIRILTEALEIFERSFHLGIKFNYPVQLFRWILAAPIEFSGLVRQRNYFALRLLYVFCCLAVCFRILPHENTIWKDYAFWFRHEHYPMCDFDQRI